MAIIEMDSALLTHPKMIRMQNLLKTERYEALGLLAMLWFWCRDHRPAGDLAGMNNDEIALIAGWKGDANLFVRALLEAPGHEVGFLERRDGSLWVHDLMEWAPDNERKKAKRRTKPSHLSAKRRPHGGQTAHTAESLVSSLSLPVSKEGETKEATRGEESPGAEKKVERRKPANVEFVDRFKAFYEQMVKRPFKYGRHHFVISEQLIREHGQAEVIEKAKTLALMCRDRSTWFTKGGWADFSIEKLSKQWNAIIPEASPPTREEEFEAEKQKRRDIDARINRALES